MSPCFSTVCRHYRKHRPEEDEELKQNNRCSGRGLRAVVRCAVVLRRDYLSAHASYSTLILPPPPMAVSLPPFAPTIPGAPSCFTKP